MDDNGGQYLRWKAEQEAELANSQVYNNDWMVPAAQPYPEIITTTSTSPFTSTFDPRPFGYSPNIVKATYHVRDFDIEETESSVNIGLNDGARWGGFALGSPGLDEFLTILNYLHAKAKGEISG